MKINIFGVTWAILRLKRQHWYGVDNMMWEWHRRCCRYLSTLQTILENLHIAADGLREGEETLPDALKDIKESLKDCIAWIKGFPDVQAYSDKVCGILLELVLVLFGTPVTSASDVTTWACSPTSFTYMATNCECQLKLVMFWRQPTFLFLSNMSSPMARL